MASKGQKEFALTPAGFEVLLAPVDGDRHGYGIRKEIRRRRSDAVGPGSLYGILGRFVAAGLVEEAPGRPDPELDDERRRYPKPTDRGKKLVGEEARKLEKKVGRAHDKGPPHRTGPEKTLPIRVR